MSIQVPGTPLGTPSAKGKGKGKAVQSIEEANEELIISSPYPAVVARAYVDLMPKASEGKRYDPRGPSILQSVPPPPNALRDMPSTADRSPENPFRDQRKIRMLNALEATGPTGLAKCLYDECEEIKKKGQYPSITWDIMLRDRDTERKAVSLLLSLLPVEVTKSLIKGTLAQDVYMTPEVNTFYKAYMAPGDFPGIYANVLVKEKISMTSTRPRTEAGKYLSANQIDSLCTKYTSYIDDTDPAFRDAIDSAFNQRLQGAGPRWASNDRQRQTGRTWIKKAKGLYCHNVAPQDKDRPHLSAPFEVGWSQNVRTRLLEHRDNGSTTNIFAFNNAITRLSLTKGGLDSTNPPFTVVLFPIWEHDEHLANVGEILGSMLVGSYWFQGGFNCTYAGTFSLGPLQGSSANYEIAKDRVQRMIDHTMLPDALLKDSVDLRKKLQSYKSAAKSRQDLEDLKNRLRAAEETSKKVDEEYEGLKKRLQEVSKRAKAVKEKCLERWEAREDLTDDERKVGATLKRVDEDFDSSIRVQQESRRLITSNRTGFPARPGPAAIVQPLSAEENAEVQARAAKLRANAEREWEEYVKRRDARDGK
ncbi:MAG: hypothetical protein L6R40_005427 [Gallowayella cf. fulva]|nr:MAG: hypothetical protein L6R40_005427 [Xanthomendoza cf. fulva]